MSRAGHCLLLAVAACLMSACAAREYPVRDDHDHTPGPPLMPVHPPQSEPAGG